MMMRLLSLLSLLGALREGEAFAPLQGIRVTKVADSSIVDLGKSLSEENNCKMVILGTYAADFNAIEYCQRVRHYLPRLKERGVESVQLVLNAEPSACSALAALLDLPEEVQLLSDPSGAAGRAFGVGRGWLPDEDTVSPFLKLFGMLFGLGAAQTLPSVITGYLGNPWGEAGWIEASLAVGQRGGRWPDTALDLNSDGDVATNKFAELPLVGGWGRRPLELATLRLQNMLGVSLQQWPALGPDVEAWPAVLTQLGGVVVLDGSKVKYEWRDPGICAVANFDDILDAL